MSTARFLVPRFVFFLGLALAAPAAESAAPSLALSLRGVRDGRVEQGEPVAVAVRIAPAAGAKAPWVLTPAAGGAWPEAVRVELVREGDTAAVARGALVGRPAEARLTLEARQAAGGVWLLSSAAMQAVAPGLYQVHGILNLDTGAGAPDAVRALPLRLTVVAPSAEPLRVSQRTAARAYEAAAAGRIEAAAGMLDAQLKLTPDDRALLLLRAALSEQAGNDAAALALVNRAARGLPARLPPPSELHDLRTRLQARLLAAPADGPASVAAPPAWSAAPAFLFPAVVPAQLAPRPAAAPSVPASASAAAAPPPRPAPPVGPAPASAAPAAPRAPSGPARPLPTVATRTLPAAAGRLVPAQALNDAKIIADPAGQWAADARAGSSYGNPHYGPNRATGAPNVRLPGNSADAWCPAEQNKGTEWLEVTFAQPVRATEVRVRQTYAVGGIVKIEALAADDSTQLWWEGVDPYEPPPRREIAWLAVQVPPTDFPVAKVRITLNLAAVAGWEQIDAVQLVAAP